MGEVCAAAGFSPLLIGQIGGAGFFAILFLQSSLDKLNDWNGNISWITGYFEKTPFKRFVFILLAILTVLELASGMFALAAIFTTLFKGCTTHMYFAALLSGLALLSLFLGMRVAKDYSSAGTLAGYFAAWTGWIVLLSL